MRPSGSSARLRFARGCSTTETSSRGSFDRVALAALWLFLVAQIVGPLAEHRVLDEGTLGDHLINLSLTQRAVDALAYPPHFYYPPPFLALEHTLASLGLLGATAIWFSLLAAAALACPLLTLHLAGLGAHPRRTWLVIGAVAAVLYYLQWDLRAANSNLVALGCVLAALALAERGRESYAGLLLAVAVSIKLYSVLLLPYLLWRGRVRWLAWTIAGLVAAFGLVPLLAFGPAPATALTRSWLESLAQATEPAAMPDYFKSLARTLWLLFSNEGGEQAVAHLSGAALRGVLAGVWLLWLAAVSLQLARSQRYEPKQRLYLDVAVLLMLPLPFSPVFQPHHAVVALLPAMWATGIAADPERARAPRAAAVGLLLAAAALVKAVPDWPARALAIHAALALYLLSTIVFGAESRPRPLLDER